MNTTALAAAAHRNRPAFTIGPAVVALAGVPAIWMPFAYHTSPASALFEHGFFNLWPLAWPTLLAIPIAIALFRWASSQRLSTAERWCGRLLAAAAYSVTVWFLAGTTLNGDWPSRAREWSGFSVLIVMLICGPVLAARALRTDRARDGLDAIVMMEVAYLANAVWCLLSFATELEVGAYAVLLTSVVYAIQTVDVQLAGPSRRASTQDGAPAPACNTSAARLKYTADRRSAGSAVSRTRG